MKPFLPTWLRFAALGLTATALAQPIITTQPRTQFQWENKRVSLNVTTSGAGPFRYQWQFNEADLPGATNRVLTLPRAQLTNDGNYRVVVTDAAGGVTTSEVARVMVRAWPEPAGPRIPEFARLDTNMQTALLNNATPGGSLAIVKDGRLVFARGYGFADLEQNELFQPDSRSRSGSIAKTLTAATFLHLVEQGNASLDEPVLNLLRLPEPDYPEAVLDSRWTNITARLALSHSGGWNEDTAINPLGTRGFVANSWPEALSSELHLTSPPSRLDLVKWILGKPLQYRPGSMSSYSDTGFDVMGIAIERVSGLPYETAVRRFLADAGITRMQIGGDFRAGRAPGEVVYYLHPTQDLSNFFYYEPRPLNFDLPYAWPTRLYAASGGWIFSTIDLARFVAAADGDSAYRDILRADTIATMLSRPNVPSTPTEGYFGLGWDSVTPRPGIWYKTGGDVAAMSLAMKYRNGTCVLFTLNSLFDGGITALRTSISATLDGIRQWPTHDLFPATLSYDAWRTGHFTAAELADSALSGDDSDPDGDGVSNLWEYATGTNPRASSGLPRLAASLVGGDSPALSFTYRRLLLAHEVEYTLEDSADLIHWSPTAVEHGDPELNADGTVTARATANVSQPGRFFRLRISRKAQ